MEDPQNVFAGAWPSALADEESSLEVEWRLARAGRVNVLLTGMPRVNPLLTGLTGVIRNVLERLLPDLHEPVISWCPGERLVLPPVARAGTLILHDVAALAYDDQLRVLEWLDRAEGRTQVVSTASSPLLPYVHAKAFDASLYYRLNTVCIDLRNC